MNKVFKAATSVGSVALLLSGMAHAAAPMLGFGSWTASQAVDNGSVKINGVGCDTAGGWTCGDALTGDGFFQRQITDKNGNIYFQTIITDSGMGRVIAAADEGAPANLTFYDESFVRAGNLDGIADKQSIKELQSVTSTNPNSERWFKNETELSTGWAAKNTGTDLKLYQGIYDTKNEGFRTDFWLAQEKSQANQGILITSRVGLAGTWGDLGQAGKKTDYQDFVFIELKGTMNNTASNVHIPNNSSFSTSNTMAWTSGQDIKATWVGQTMKSTLGQTFVYEGYDNVSTAGYDLVSAFSLSQTHINPTYWQNSIWTPVNQRDVWNEANPKLRPTDPSWY